MSEKPQHGNGRNQTFPMVHPTTKQEITVGDWQEEEFAALGYERKTKPKKPKNKDSEPDPAAAQGSDQGTNQDAPPAP